MYRASIDIGSNSILLLIAEVKGKSCHPILEKSYVTSLGKGIDQTNKFSEESMGESYIALKEYASDIESHQVPLNEVVVTATEASRVSTNAPSFYKKIFDELGLHVKIISGEEEAFYSAKGVLLNSEEPNEEDQFLMDIGGASTEFIRCEKDPFSLKESISLPIGVVRLTEKLGKYYDYAIQDLKNESADIIKKSIRGFSLQHFVAPKIIGIAGTMTSLAMMKLELDEFSEEKINSFELSSEILQELLLKVHTLNPEEIKKKYPILGKRSSTIVAGILISLFFSNELNCDTYVVSTRGLRYGTILGLRA
ncbi:hypothetical protein N9N67_05530 [Bacteriovoracaceae bacterium]|nr:hypothetical protein [Bacteriovoracaceae bacterium]